MRDRAQIRAAWRSVFRRACREWQIPRPPRSVGRHSSAKLDRQRCDLLGCQAIEEEMGCDEVEVAGYEIELPDIGQLGADADGVRPARRTSWRSIASLASTASINLRIVFEQRAAKRPSPSPRMRADLRQRISGRKASRHLLRNGPKVNHSIHR